MAAARAPRCAQGRRKCVDGSGGGPVTVVPPAALMLSAERGDGAAASPPPSARYAHAEREAHHGEGAESPLLSPSQERTSPPTCVDVLTGILNNHLQLIPGQRCATARMSELGRQLRLDGHRTVSFFPWVVTGGGDKGLKLMRRQSLQFLIFTNYPSRNGGPRQRAHRPSLGACPRLSALGASRNRSD
jgi:hypothetical protein